MDQNPAQEKGGRLNEQHDPATGGSVGALLFAGNAEEKSAECVSSSFLLSASVSRGVDAGWNEKEGERERKDQSGTFKNHQHADWGQSCLPAPGLFKGRVLARVPRWRLSLFLSRLILTESRSPSLSETFENNQKPLPCVLVWPRWAFSLMHRPRRHHHQRHYLHQLTEIKTQHKKSTTPPPFSTVR